MAVHTGSMDFPHEFEVIASSSIGPISDGWSPVLDF